MSASVTDIQVYSADLWDKDLLLRRLGCLTWWYSETCFYGKIIGNMRQYKQFSDNVRKQILQHPMKSPFKDL